MSKFSHAVNNLSAGELGDKLAARQDIKEYNNSARYIENVIPLRGGGGMFRPSFRHELDISGIASECQTTGFYEGSGMLEYIAANDVAYTVLLQANNEPVDLTFDFVDGDVSVGDDQISETDHDMITGRAVILSTTGTLPGGLSAGTYYVIKVDDDTFQLATSLANAEAGTQVDITSAAGGGTHTCASLTFTSGSPRNCPVALVDSSGSEITVEDVSGYNRWPASLDPQGYHSAQIGDVMFIVHESGLLKPVILFPKVGGGGTFNLADFDLGEPNVATDINRGLKWPFKDENLTAITMTADASNATTMTASSAFFTADMVGTVIRAEDTTEGMAVITGFTSTTVVSVSTLVNFNAALNAVTTWRVSAWSEEDGWPRTVSGYFQRLVYGGSPTARDTVWNSLAGNVHHMMQKHLAQDDSGSDGSGINYFGDGVQDDDAFSFIIASTRSNAITWMSSGDSLNVGTYSTEYTIIGTEGKYGPFNKDIKARTNHGSSGVRAAQAERTSLFVSRDGKKLRDFTYNPDNGSYTSRNLSLLNDTILVHGFDKTADGYNNITIQQLAWQESRNLLWVLTSSGGLIGIAIDESGGVLAWHRYTVAGTDVVVHGVIVTPNSNNTFDDVWIQVSSTINSATYYSLERMGDNFEHPVLDNASTDEDDYPWYLDSAIRYDSSSATVLTNIVPHLVGETVYAIADGEVQGPFTVASGGTVTLTTAAENAIVGLKYEGYLKFRKPEIGSDKGSAQILKSRMDRVLLKLYKSLGGQISSDDEDYHDIEYPADQLTDGETYTGDILMEDFDQDSDYDGEVYIKMNEPKPFYMLGLFTRGVVEN